jgi:uncharacterized protein DUF3761
MAFMRSMFLAGLFSTALAVGAPPVTAVHAQTTTTNQQATPADQSGDTAKSHAEQAGDEAKDAGKSAAQAARDAGKAAAEGTKSVAKTAAKDAKKAGKAVAQGTEGAVKTTGKETQKVGSAIKGEVTGDHKEATAKCGDGTFWYSVEQTDACKDHGGVAEWIKK